MKRRLLAAAVLMSAWGAYSQVGIGTLTPDASSQLDVTASDKGMLIPRVGLTSTTDATTITNGNVNSLLVYNTNTQNDITPGYYYWYDNKWMRIVNEEDVAGLDTNTTNVSLTVVGGELVLTDSEGNEVTIPLSEINIPTTLVQNPDGTYTYTNEEGTTVTIDATENIINNIDNILNNTEVLNELIEVLGDTYVGGNVYYDGDQFTYIDESGETHTINFEEIVQANESVTTLVDNADGTYTYTSEDGTVTVVDVPASVINQFEEIVNGGPVTIDGDTYNTIEEYIQHLVETNETVTTLVNNNDGTYTYTSEDGTVTVVDVPASVINQFEEIVNGGPVTIDGDTYNTIEEYIQHLVETNETVTTLVNNNDGTYTYTSEDGTVTVVDVPASVINQFEEIVNGGPVTIDGDTYNTIEEYIQHLVETNETVTTLVNNNDGTYTYTSEDGTVTVVDVPASVINQFEEIVNGGPVTIDGDTYNTIEEYIQHLVETNETVTTLVNNNDGTYTYTSEDGTVTVVDVPASVINQFEEIVNGGPVTIDGDTYNTIEEYIQHLVETNETVTTLVNNNDGTYTYTSEDGTVTVVDVPASVINQFEEIVNGGPVTIDGDTYNTIEEYIQHLVETNETVTTLVNNNDGTYTYTSEDGTVTVVDVPASVINQFEEIVNGGPVTIDGDTYNTIEEYIQHLVETNETVTTLVNNNDGTYTYTSEDGTVTVVDVPASVINQFEEIVNGGPVTIDGDTYNTIEEYIQHLVETNETVTTLVNNNDGTYTYTSEDGTVTVVDVPASVINQFEEIVNGGPVTIDGDTYNTIEEYIQHLVETNETVTTLETLGEGQYLYTSEDGTETTINVAQDVIENFETIVNESNTEVIEQLITVLGDTYVGGNVYYDGDTFTYVDEAGDSHVINFEEIVQANETVTTLETLGEGQYLYTSEDGTETTINVAQDVIENFETIVNESNTEVIEQLITVLGDTYVGGNVYYDGDTFTYVDEAGDIHVINFEEIVQANETVTTLETLGEGQYLYTSEDGTETTINVAQDVIENFETIVNESNTEVIEQLITVLGDTYVGGNVYYDGDTFTYVDEAGDSHVINFEEIVQANETVTTLEVLGEGQYLYTSEDGTETTINVAQDVIENFETIVNESNTEVIEQLITVLGDTYVGGNVYYDGDTFTYVDEAGDSHVINFEEIVQANETVTTLEVLGEGQYLYTSEDGTETTINVAQDVIENFETIVNESNTEVIEQLITVLGDTYVGGNVYYDGDTFTYVDEAGDSHVINFEEIVQANETVTTLVNNNDGTYTYTSEDGTVTVVDVPASVINQFEEIVNGGPVTIDGDTYNTIEEYIQHLVETNETVTTLEILGEGQYLYTSEDGTETTINVAQDVIENFETIVNESNTEVIEQLITVLGDTYVGGNVYYDGDTFTYVDESGDSHVINFEEIVQANETVTTLETLGEGQYLYTSEDGTETTINVAQDVIENFETIVNESNTEVIEQLITVLGDTYVGGNVYYDGDTFTYVDESGDSHVINFEEIVQANESVTTLVDNADGTYTYTSEDGTVTVVDVPASVINQFEEIVNGGPVTIEGEEYTTIEEYIQHLVETNETVTTLVNNNDGTYTYTSEDGTVTVVDVPASVINQFEEIVNGGPVTIDGDTYNTIEEYIQHLVETNETVTTLVNNNDGTYTYTSEDGTVTVVDVPASVINQFEEIVNGGPVTIDGDTYNTIEEYIQHLVETNETVTTLVNNNDGTYTYTSEDDTETIIKPVDYSYTVQETGREWVNENPVMEIVADITLTTANNTFVLPNDVPVGSTVISVRFISKANGSISTNVLEYNNTTRELVLGTTGSLTVLHPAGDYYLIVEYAEN